MKENVNSGDERLSLTTTAESVIIALLIVAVVAIFMGLIKSLKNSARTDYDKIKSLKNSARTDYDKMILCIGFASLITGSVLIIYTATTPQYFQPPQNMVPAQFATLIAATLIFLGTAILAYWFWSKGAKLS